MHMDVAVHKEHDVYVPGTIVHDSQRVWHWHCCVAWGSSPVVHSKIVLRWLIWRCCTVNRWKCVHYWKCNFPPVHLLVRWLVFLKVTLQFLLLWHQPRHQISTLYYSTILRLHKRVINRKGFSFASLPYLSIYLKFELLRIQSGIAFPPWSGTGSHLEFAEHSTSKDSWKIDNLKY